MTAYNGTEQNVDPNELIFPGSGIRVILPRLSPEGLQTITRAVTASIPSPDVPKVVTELGVEENRADPEYLKALRSRVLTIQKEIGVRIYRLALRQMIVFVDEEALNRYRDDMAAIGAPVDSTLSDRELFITHLCMKSALDMRMLMAHMMSANIPTEEAVREHAKTFRDNIQGQRPDVDQTAIVRD